MKRRLLIFLPAILLQAGFLFAQQPHCHTNEYMELMNSMDATYRESIDQTDNHTIQLMENNSLVRSTTDEILYIPVVVHVVYNIAAENISDAQIFSQIDVLNEDFRRTNDDASDVPSGFEDVAADSYIQFVLTSVDPDGNPTSGITRNETEFASWNFSAGSGVDSAAENVKSEATGGADIWDRDCYLNIWVCDLGSSILGYASPPGSSESTDGVVIGYKWFGRNGSAIFPYNKGRTTTHEVGHWLGLKHIWGDDGGSCAGSDGIADTPNQGDLNFGCPTYPLTDACSPSIPGVMFMNYMDYTDDACMFMFTQGQANKMRSVLEDSRSGILACANSVAIPSNQKWMNGEVYPNPVQETLFVRLPELSGSNWVLQILDLTGRIQLEESITGGTDEVSVASLMNGTYILCITNGEELFTEKIVINR